MSGIDRFNSFNISFGLKLLLLSLHNFKYGGFITIHLPLSGSTSPKIAQIKSIKEFIIASIKHK